MHLGPHCCRWALSAVILPLAIALGACATSTPADAPVWIYGEQHDQPSQQREVAAVVRDLAARQHLAAVVIEMADRGRDTAGLPPSADEAAARDALAWDSGGWPWPPYAPVVMAAVAAGVPVFGGNLPRSATRDAMANTRLDATVPNDVRQRIAEAVREGHCNLLPDARLPGMLRVQIARDREMAGVVRSALASAAPGRKVLLLTGAQHASRDRGVPLHLAAAGVSVKVTMFGDRAAGLQADEHQATETSPQPDHCEALRRQLQPPAPAS